MANTAPAVVTITSKSLLNDSVAKTFSQVTQLNFNYFENTIQIVDATGSFYFGYTTIGTVTVTIVGGTTTVAIS